MVIKVYVSMITFTQEVKKNQQRALMILESKNIPFVTIDITDPGCEDSKDYMNENAKPKGNNKVPMTPQIFNDAEYCGDFEDLDMANETDTLGEFLKLTDEEKKSIKIGITSLLPEERAKQQQEGEKMTNGVSASREAEVNEVPAAATESTTEDKGLRETEDVSGMVNEEPAAEGVDAEVISEELKEEKVEGMEAAGEVEEEKEKEKEKEEEEGEEEEEEEEEGEEEGEAGEADTSTKVKEVEEEEAEA
ncbi:SH3 domain-binding glutamic acid-rich protein homolog [Penaeus monodon]|uniref:SH3 domain-binding glutamic acid-rich protein homolog n=1 Tax=Penaeus monodon TaxID=6687 RepID=UPI0018A7241F|nr:SH3 domain-binding glutamic acid-rich protein homolog [Penaeus monodon]